MTIGITTVMLLLLSERIVRIKYKKGIEVKEGIEGNNQARRGRKVEERRERSAVLQK